MKYLLQNINYILNSVSWLKYIFNLPRQNMINFNNQTQRNLGRLNMTTDDVPVSKEVVAAAAAYTTIQLIGILGNLLVIHTIYSQRRLHTNYYFLISHLAISDAIVLITVTDKTVYFFGSVLFNTAVFKILYITRLISYMTANISLIFIGMVRYRAIFSPRSPVTGKKLGYVRSY